MKSNINSQKFMRSMNFCELILQHSTPSSGLVTVAQFPPVVAKKLPKYLVLKGKK